MLFLVSMFMHNKRIKGVSTSCLLFILTALCLIGCGDETYNYDEEICQKLTFSETGSLEFGVHPYIGETGLEVILPTHWDIDQLQVSCAEPIGLAINHQPIDTSWKSLKVIVDDSLPFESPHSKLSQIKFFQSAMETMFVNTASGSMAAVDSSPDHSFGESGQAAIYDEEGEQTFHKSFKDLRGRGNSSWKYEIKKSYNITFDKKEKIKGLKKDKEFCLVSGILTNAFYNYIGFDVAKRMQTSFPIDGKLINVYFNGNYNGVYFLCNRVTIGKNFVNIFDIEKDTKLLNTDVVPKYDFIIDSVGNEIGKGIINYQNPEDITGGYLIERLNYERKYNQDRAAFYDTLGCQCVFKSQKLLTTEEVKYARNALNEMLSAIKDENGICRSTNKHYSEYIDMDSFARYYLVNELLNNYDAGTGSLFLVKDKDSIDSRFKLGPIWDMDWTLGNKEAFPLDQPSGVLHLAAGSSKQKFNIFGYLAQHSDFVQLADSLYFSDLRPILKERFEQPLKEEIRHDEMLDVQRIYHYNIDTLWSHICDYADRQMQAYEFFASHRNDTSYVLVNADFGFWHTRVIFLAKKGEKMEIPQLPYWWLRDNKYFPRKSLGWIINNNEKIDINNFFPQKDCYISQKWTEPSRTELRISKLLKKFGF